ncbi:YqzL family protein [Paenibacillus sp. 2TAB19]|uniref:YqzL family protein n=1 Tax=Paenibacillus sp. 2TAB19 TaxID=3233003 RepID=UPI003F9AB0F1
MRDFSWKYFTLTGDVESFMLYKEMDQMGILEQDGAQAGENDDYAMMELEDSSS